MHVTDNLPEPWHLPIDPWLGDLEWSPDGSEILLKGFTYRVPLDGSPPIASPLTFIDRDGNSQVEITNGCRVVSGRVHARGTDRRVAPVALGWTVNQC